MFHVLKLNARGKKCEREIARLATKQCSSVPIVLSIYLLLLFHNEAFLFSLRTLTSARRLSLSDFPAFNLKTRNIGYKASKVIRINDLVLATKQKDLATKQYLTF